MFQTDLKKIASIVSGNLQKISCFHASKLIIQKISTNSRNFRSCSLFIAIKGKNFDGHHFAKQSVKNGSLAILSEKILSIDHPQIIVENTIHAIERLASWIRKKSLAKFIAITGSSGKTSVKEMTHTILSQVGSTISTKKNNNNSLGVLLTLLRVNEFHQYVVIEIGASQLGEIKFSSKIVNPDVVLINNLFASHLKGFGSFSNLSRAKSEIFFGLSKFNTAVINLDNHDIKHWKHKIRNLSKVWFFSLKKKKKSHFYSNTISEKNFFMKFDIHTPFGIARVSSHLAGLHNISNSIASAALSISVGAKIDQIEKGLKNFHPIDGRMYPVYISSEKIILDDTYNSNFGSMKSAIDVLSKMPGYRVLVVGDMLELGQYSSFYHKKISRIIQNKNLNTIISFGKYSLFISQSFQNGMHFHSKKKLTKKLIYLISIHEKISILIKGSRKMRMEEVIEDIRRRKFS
ncbi:UDP-N-acetylmuramoyl-tripeptide--D-alanyl-D-alanine ligase [Candidatus Riesia pediculicola]|uniref:UDP-N-acetylmuramoyl-tripeptide--D-alanyl-D-alanine ligase n=1 Tax=Riesia pediculicola (strain USDA) TaxID=515618 RepID=D4G8R5_RIEPU|nr:UDP-N-acetylmuramoyl-tripeptide--D-alanyl-D-alanine ligase [Candidatus Riesia pediculicola]ADD79911.1 UDP-N-acetylmuramoyl-tripeptide--D-alanyl-D-alanine ligase [Candidatus Riesia pediculicola USDA]QOJ86563.1 UDP-N-acetylmuramoyl-tripeptide--D-alanyl-D-alanine ligase [Candidatus Riesia pediculicola]